MVNQGIYWECDVPSDYVEWSRISAEAQAGDCCPPRKLKIFLGEEADIDLVLLDKNRQPSYEWAETVATVINGKFRIYTNKCFDVVNPAITYYRRPAHIKIVGCTDPDTGLIVYNLTAAGSGTTAVYSGFYFFDGVKWRRFISPAPVAVSCDISSGNIK
jgi:hypothetical protein